MRVNNYFLFFFFYVGHMNPGSIPSYLCTIVYVKSKSHDFFQHDSKAKAFLRGYEGKTVNAYW